MNMMLAESVVVCKILLVEFSLTVDDNEWETTGIVFFASSVEKSVTEAIWFWVSRPTVRLLTLIYLFCVLQYLFTSRGISVKLGTNIYHVRGHSWKGSQGRRSKVKVMIWLNAIMEEAHISAVWCRGSLGVIIFCKKYITKVYMIFVMK